MFFYIIISIVNLPNLKDPLFDKQYYVNNNGFFGSKNGTDINVLPVWNSNIFGTNIVFGIIGNGCNIDHLDFQGKNLSHLHLNLDSDPEDGNVFPYSQAEFNEKSTGLLGIAIASSNEIAITGIAPNAKYYCIKQTYHDNDKKVARSLLIHNIETDIKLISITRGCSDIHRSHFSRCKAPIHYSTIEGAFYQPGKQPIYVSPVGDDALSGIDTNTFPEVKQPHVISVADTTPYGARSFWSTRGTCNVVSAPAGGSFEPFSLSSLDPHPPTLGVRANNSFYDTISGNNGFNPKGVGSAIVSGVISLMLEVNPELQWRDIHAILALTSSQNDPYHHSWIINKAGYHYSDIYGFGWINADKAVDLAETWNSLETKIMATAFFPEIRLYTTRGGNIEVRSVLDNYNINFIEYVELDLTYSQIGNLRIDVVSPMGTRVTVIQPSNIEDTNQSVYYVIRNFYGESASGGFWRVIANREGYGNQSSITNIRIRAHGLKVKPQFPLQSNIILPNSYFALPKISNLYIDSTIPKIIECDSSITLTIKASGAFSSVRYNVYLRDGKHNTMFLLDHDIVPNIPSPIYIPCLLQNVSLFLYVENREMGYSAETNITIHNNKFHNTFHQPQPYSRFHISMNEVRIKLDFSLSLDYLPSDSDAHTCIVGIWDLERHENIYYSPHLLTDVSSISFSLDHNVSKAILYLIPRYANNNAGCNTLIQPISLVFDNYPLIHQFIVPLSSSCPTPPGILSEAEILPNTNPIFYNHIKTLVFIGSSILLLAIILLIIYRFKSVESEEDPYNVQLLGNEAIL